MCLSVFTACSQKSGDTSDVTDNAGITVSVTQKDYNHLTGMPFEDGQDKNSRPVAVMINNLKIALPQYGLSAADIIYEAVTEGGITRLMALYSDINDIDRVGPVRSARHQFVEMMLPLNAIYVHIGSSISANRMLNAYSYQDIDGIYLGSLAFMFDSEMAKVKSSEHCWFTTKDLINAGIAKNGIGTKNNFYPAFDFVEYGKDETIPADGVAVSFTYDYSGYANVGFSYDENTGKYYKYAFGAPHMDAGTNQQLAFDNVFLVLTEVGVEAENGILPDFAFDSGIGYYFYGGRYEKFLWEKGEPENPMIMYTVDGEVLKVNPGKSYVGLLDIEQTPTLNVSEEVHTSASVERVQ